VRFLVMANQKARYQAWWPGVSQVNVELGDTVKAGKLLADAGL
jgi:predicted deacylase